ncbi:metallophosphoesterase [Catenulispora rubra]|uniref:metallophosphoesterase n=1 Tax=Catenulispora rubra TaxID=280293 RepID=UPI0018920B43|nr:metallophosphoesterase [Catenulispora rubra]
MTQNSSAGSADNRHRVIPLVEQHEFFQQILRRSPVSRRGVLRGSVSAAGASFLLGGTLAGAASASASTSAEEMTTTGTIAGGFVVNGRHLSFGPDPKRQMWVAGQLFNLNTYNAVPSGIKVEVEYGHEAGAYGHTVAAEIRQLVTHVPVWNGVPTGPVTASLNDLLRADQFYVHALIDCLEPGRTYHYRFVYTKHGERGHTPDATFTTAPDGRRFLSPFTFTAYGDQGITGAPGTGRTLDDAPSLQPESSSHITDDYYKPSDPDYFDPASTSAPTDVSPVAALVTQITRVRNPVNHTPSRFTLLAGDMCYANPSGNAQPIINPAGPGGNQPGDSNTPVPPPNSGGWDDYDPYVWTSYLTTIEPSSASTPWMFNTGNHDVELFTTSLDADAATVDAYGRLGYGGHASRIDMPTNGPRSCPSVYSFTYGDVGIVSADANELSWEIQGLLGYSEGEQASWLRRRLGEFRHDPEIDFIVVFFHHCAFSTCDGHSSDGGVRKVLAPLLSEFEVDLAVQGHNHIYERSNPIKYDAATNTGSSSVQATSKSFHEAATVHPQTDGTTYITVGSGGRPRYSWSGAVETDRNFLTGVDTGAPGNGTTVTADPATSQGPSAAQLDFTREYETVDWSQARYSDYAFIALDVVPAAPDGTATMTMRAINEQGVEFDRVVFKRDVRRRGPYSL